MIRSDKFKAWWLSIKIMLKSCRDLSQYAESLQTPMIMASWKTIGQFSRIFAEELIGGCIESSRRMPTWRSIRCNFDQMVVPGPLSSRIKCGVPLKARVPQREAVGTRESRKASQSDPENVRESLRGMGSSQKEKFIANLSGSLVDFWLPVTIALEDWWSVA